MADRYNLARFDLVSVRLVVNCVLHGSLSAAAREAPLAIAAASRRLSDLEHAVGGPLFVRHGRGLLPTPAGRVFMRHAVNLLQSMEQLNAELTDLHQGVVRHVRLCASTAAISQFLPPLLAQYARRAEHIRVDLDEQVSKDVPNALRESRADVGIFVEGPETHNLQCRLFREDELVLVLPHDHPVAGAGPIAFAELLDEEWITLSDGAALLQLLFAAADSARKSLRVRMQVRSFDVVCHLVASGLGIAILPKAAALPMLQSMKLIWRPLAEPWASRRLLLATRAGETDDAVGDLAAFLEQPGGREHTVRRTESCMRSEGIRDQ